MDQRANYLLQILETIGSPLMSAIIAGTAPDSQENPQQDAQAIAALLGKTVEASIELGNIMDINPAEAQDDTLRVALAGLAGPLVAAQYSKRAQVPESVDLKKMTSSLQAVLTFSDNFSPTAETVERLKNLQANGQPVDEYQTQIQYMQALMPVVEAIAAFPFGQAEAKLIMDVSDKLVKKSVELREALLPGVSDEAVQKRIELGLLRVLGGLYSACHKIETQKAMSMSEDQRAAGLSMDPVWKGFDVRCAMLEALAGSMVPGVSAAGAGSKSPAPPVAPQVPPAAAEAPPPASPPTTPPPVQEQPPAAPAAPPTAPPPAAPPPQQPEQTQQPAGQNPMSMFAKPKDGASETPPPAAAPPAAPPPAAPPPAETPPPPPNETAPAAPPPPPAEPPAAPPPQQQPENPPPQDQAGGGPMSFFKKKDEE